MILGLFICLLLCLTNASINSLDNQVLNSIYQQNKIYIIYVHGSLHNFQVESIFNSHCFGDKLCAILEPNNLNYNEYMEFIGYQDDHFFLILDPISKRKFIQPIPTDSFTSNDLLSFQYKFIYKELQPFFASEPLPAQVNSKCSKLVGKNVGEFLRRKERVKVILLFNLNQHCPDCDKIIEEFIPFAEAKAEDNLLAFGYFNTLLNDHPVIQDEKAPSYLIFIDQQHSKPFQIQNTDIEGLAFFLDKTLEGGLRAPKSPQNDNPSDQQGDL